MYLVALAAKVEEVYNKMLPGVEYQDRRKIALEIFYEKVKSEDLNSRIAKLFDPEKKYYNQNMIRINLDEVYPGIFDEYISIFNNEKDCVKYGVGFENTIIYSKLFETYEIIAITYLNKINENSVEFLKKYINASSKCDKQIIDKDIELLEFLFMFSIILVHKLSHDYHYSNKKMAEYFNIALASFNSREIIFLKCINLINKIDANSAASSMSVGATDNKSGLLVHRSLTISLSGNDCSAQNIKELKAAKSFFLTKKVEIVYSSSHSNFLDDDKRILDEISSMIKKRDTALEKCTDHGQILSEHAAIIKNYNQKYMNFLNEIIKRNHTCLNDALIINNYNCELVLSYEISKFNGKLTDLENEKLLDLNELISCRNKHIKAKPEFESIINQKFDKEYRCKFLYDFEWILKKRHALCSQDKEKIDYCKEQINISIDAIYGSKKTSVDRSSSPQALQIAPEKKVVNLQVGSNQVASASNVGKSNVVVKNTRKTPPCMLYASSSSSSSSSTVYPTEAKLSNEGKEKELAQNTEQSDSSKSHKGCWSALSSIPTIFSTGSGTEQHETPIYAGGKNSSVARPVLTPSGRFHSQTTKRLGESKSKLQPKKPS